jgi:NADPH-dependent 2,4-dienoyl-CoA reductase/sulfur reductase-like enzyme
MRDECRGPTAIEIEQVVPPAESNERGNNEPGNDGLGTNEPPVVVIGAGPVGLAAAAHLAERGMSFLVVEAGRQVGASVAQWGHVRVFSPWRYNIDGAARRLLEADGWNAPDLDWLPTGAELVDDYLAPLGRLLGSRLRLGAKVTAITRLGFDRVRTAGRRRPARPRREGRRGPDRPRVARRTGRRP